MVTMMKHFQLIQSVTVDLNTTDLFIYVWVKCWYTVCVGGNGIVSSMDLVNIMNIGNELYSGLSSLSKQSQLPLTEVLRMIIVFNINYQFQYSPSYNGTIHGTCEVQDFNYYMSFANAMQALLEQNYNSFF